MKTVAMTGRSNRIDAISSTFCTSYIAYCYISPSIFLLTRWIQLVLLLFHFLGVSILFLCLLERGLICFWPVVGILAHPLLSPLEVPLSNQAFDACGRCWMTSHSGCRECQALHRLHETTCLARNEEQVSFRLNQYITYFRIEDDTNCIVNKLIKWTHCIFISVHKNKPTKSGKIMFSSDMQS